MIRRLQSLNRRALLRFLAWQARRRRRGYSGPVAVGRTSAYLGRTARVDYEPPHGRGWHGQGVLVASQPSDRGLAYQDLLLRVDGRNLALTLPLSVTVEVLPS